MAPFKTKLHTWSGKNKIFILKIVTMLFLWAIYKNIYMFGTLKFQYKLNMMKIK